MIVTDRSVVELTRPDAADQPAGIWSLIDQNPRPAAVLRFCIVPMNSKTKIAARFRGSYQFFDE
jgi:hypothetical protein